MTTTLAAFGLRPSFHQSGQSRSTRRTILAAYTTAIYKGDPILIDAAGGVQIAITNSGRIDGVFMGCEYTDPTGKRNVSPYWPGTASCTDIVAYIADDPNVIFEVQADATLAIDALGAGFGISATVGTGSTATGLSLAALSASSVGTGTKQLQVVDIVPREDNAWGDTYPIVRVRLANSALAAPLTTV